MDRRPGCPDPPGCTTGNLCDVGWDYGMGGYCFDAAVVTSNCRGTATYCESDAASTRPPPEIEERGNNAAGLFT
jgi:hypothetical protein